LLRAVAERLTSCVREGDTVARLGGDEFAIVLYTANPIGEAAAIADRIAASLTAPFKLMDQEVLIGTSIGIAMPSEDCDADQLIRRADLALYSAKAEGGDCHRFFDARLHQRTSALRRAS